MRVREYTMYDTNMSIYAENINKIKDIYGFQTIDKLTELVNRNLGLALDHILQEQKYLRKNEEAMMQLDRKCPGRSEHDFDDFYDC